MLTGQQKQQLTIDLYKQGKTIREIAKRVHMSFSDIGAIIKREFGSEKLELSREAQILKLWRKGTKPIDIAIKFNITADEVQKRHREYRDLCGMNELNKIYDEHGGEIEPFIQLYKTMKEQGLSTEDIIRTVRYGKDLPILELKYEKVTSDVTEIEIRKQTLLSEIEGLEDTIDVSRSVVTSIDQVIEQKSNEIKSLECEKQKLENKILWMMGFKEYRKIKDIARQQIETTLKDKQALLLVTLVAIIEAFKHDPEKQILLSNLPNDGANQPYYLEQRKKLLELAEQIHRELANDLMIATMNETFNEQTVVSLS